MKATFWIAAFACWFVATIFALGALVSFVAAPKSAARQREIRTHLEQAAGFVDEAIRQSGRLPSSAEFAAAMPGYELYSSRPIAEDRFRFPEWTEDATQYAVGMWCGESMEFYDAQTKQTTVDSMLTVRAWRVDAMYPLAFAACAAFAPFVVILFVRKRKKPNQALQTTSMTRSVYEKTIEFGHPQRGV